MASKLAWLLSKRGLILAVAALMAAVFGAHVHSDGLWDGPG